ncbi:MAG TPA: hypothetical protein VG317_03255 [Pseudonocardiaceae bacterium]|nr:hypothetical protein [Pseudonocardiaceae bacterium]
MLKRTKVAVVAGVSTLALAGLGGIAFAASDSGPAGSPAVLAAASTTTGTPGAAAKPKARRVLPAHFEHGTFTVWTKSGDRTVTAQRGQVTAVSPTSITVRSKDGFTDTYTVNGSTKVRKQKQASAIGDVATGDQVTLVAGEKADVATRIADSGPAGK